MIAFAGGKLSGLFACDGGGWKGIQGEWRKS